MKKEIVSLLLFIGLFCNQICAQEYNKPRLKNELLKNNNTNEDDIKIPSTDFGHLEKAELIEELLERQILKPSPDKKTLEVDSNLLDKLQKKGLLYDFKSDNGTICV
jgi:predicted class III extradiol MEMO1 family dioxygenase